MEMENTRGSVWRKWDLHLHSTASDGKCSPEELIDESIAKGIEVIALTDHHTVNNINEIKRLGKEKGISVISGIEFRTEYGQKSVHMIGLFPDKFEETILDEAALNDWILAPLGLSRTEIIRTARSTGKTYSNDDMVYKEGLLQVQVDFKQAANLIHKYGGLVSVHAGSKSNSFEEEMKHEGTGPKNVTDLVDSLGTVKEEILREYIDICEVRNSKEAPFYQKEFNKPAIAASDAHNKGEIARNYVWIKGDTTFEGLRQILFEPENRVMIQMNEPEQKNDYLVIDALKVKHEDFGEQVIPFNPGLNTIIGGRSSGKSVLLGCIARLCGDFTPIKKDKTNYDAYIDSIIKGMSVEWRDHSESGNRKIDFFPQSYIINLATDKKAISELVVRILRSEENFNEKISDLKDFLLEHSGKIRALFAQYKSLKQEKEILHEEMLALGNKQGIQQEIEKIKSCMAELKLGMPEGLSEAEETKYELQKEQLIDFEKQKERALHDIKLLNEIKTLQLMVDISDKLFDLSDSLSELVENNYNELRSKVTEAWKERVDAYIGEQEAQIKALDEKIKYIEDSDEYCKAQSLYTKNLEFVRYSEKLKVENKRLSNILEKEKAIEDREKRISELKSNIVKEHSMFYMKFKQFSDSVILEKDNVKVYPYISFKHTEYVELINRYLDGRSSANQNVINYQYENSTAYTDFIAEVFDNLYLGKHTLRRGVNVEEVVEQLITFNGFAINYNIQYQGDDLDSMSEGKMAFVILRLLLDFSSSDYPILIDQPEDDLDNRAIYTELVQYLRTKKKLRQIILVTHNPNIVVGADAEEIIVANQHGINSPNPKGVKFMYRTGALEESFQNDNSNILLCQGIREHVCDLLEGGNAAFQERENKYHLEKRKLLINK